MTSISSSRGTRPQRVHRYAAAISIIHIVLGVITMLALFISIPLRSIWLVNTPFWPGLDRPAGFTAIDDEARSLILWALANIAIAFVSAAWLIAIGVLELIREQALRRQRIAWALTRLLHACSIALFTLQLIFAQRAALPDPTSQYKDSDFIFLLALIGLIISFLFRTAWPFFLLIAAACRR